MSKSDLEFVFTLASADFNPTAFRSVSAPIPGGEVRSESVEGLWAELGDPEEVKDVHLFLTQGEPARVTSVFVGRRHAAATVKGADETWVIGRVNQLEVALRRFQYKRWRILMIAAPVLFACFVALVVGTVLITHHRAPLIQVVPLLCAQLWASGLFFRRYRSFVRREFAPKRDGYAVVLLILTAVAALAAVGQFAFTLAH